jgi:hypothetical protein
VRGDEVPERNLKFGKRPFVGDDRDFKLSVLEAASPLPIPPRRFGHGQMYHNQWGILGNDHYGDCVFAGFAHQAMISSKLGGKAQSFTTSGVLADYGAVTGFHPDDPSTDNGTNVREGLNFWRRVGIQTAGGARHKIGAFVSIPPQDWDALQACAYVFSSVGIGWQVPETIWDQWDHGEAFDVVDENARIEGGHYTIVPGRSGLSMGGMITWGRRKGFTRDFYETYNDESWAIVFPDELKKGKNERGYDLSQLNEMLSSLG